MAETREPGVSVAAAARRNGVHVSQVYAWMRDPRFSARTDKPINAFLAVDVADDADAEPADEQNPLGDRAAQPSLSQIEIETACGARVRCDGAVDEDALVRVLSALKRAT